MESAVFEALPVVFAQKIKSVKAKLRSELAELRNSSEERRSTEEIRLQLLETELRALKESALLWKSEKKREKAELGDRMTSMSEVNVKIDRFSSDVDYIRASIVELATQLHAKTSNSDFLRLEAKVATLCPTSKVDQLASLVDTKADQVALPPLHSEIQSLRSELHEKYAERDGIYREVQRVEEKLEGCFKLYVTSAYFMRVNMEVQKTVDMLRLRIDESTGELNRKGQAVKEELDRLRRNVELKASQAQVADVNRALSHCAASSQVDSLSKDVSSVQKLTSSFQLQLTTSLTAQDRVLQRFDEMFLEKANKVDFRELEMKLCEVTKHINFERRVDAIEEQVGKIFGVCEMQSAENEDLKRHVEACIQVMKGVKSEKREISYLKNTLQEIRESLFSKADKMQISELTDTKASSTEVSSISKSLGAMHRLEKITLILLQHTIKYITGVSDAKSLELGSAEWLQKHADLAAAWVSLYEPVTNEIEVPKEWETTVAMIRPGRSRTPTTPTTRPPTAALSLLTPGRKSRPVTPTSIGSSKMINAAISSRRITKRSILQPPSLDSSLFPG